MDFSGPWNDNSNGIEMVTAPSQPIAEATASEVTTEIYHAVNKMPPTKKNSKKTR
jgi:hypothetical protein